MTRIEALLPPSRLDALRAAFAGHPWISGLTVLEVKRWGEDGRHGAVYRAAEYDVDVAPEVKVELVVPTPLVPRVLDELERWARGERVSTGTIVVARIEEAVRIRTGERGEHAL